MPFNTVQQTDSSEILTVQTNGKVDGADRTEFIYDGAGDLVSITGTNDTTVSSVTEGSTMAEGVVEFGPIDELAPDAGIFELDLTIKYTDGPVDACVPETTSFEPVTETSLQPGLGEPITCELLEHGLDSNLTGVLDGEILSQVETLDTWEGVLYVAGSDMIMTLIEPDLIQFNSAASAETGTNCIECDETADGGAAMLIPGFDVASDMFIFQAADMVAQDVTLDLEIEASDATTEVNRFGETYPDDLSDDLALTKFDVTLSQATFDDLVL